MQSSRARLSTFEDSAHEGADPAGRPTAERLFDISAALFCEKGYAATTTREIAAAAGIQQASLYHHVASKEDLLHQICVSSLQQLLTDVRSAVNAASNPLERIEVLARTHLRTILRHQMRHVTMLNELRALSGPHRTAVMDLRKKYANLVRAIIEDAQAAGAVRTDIPARYLYLALLNILNWAVIWFRRGQTLSEDELARIFISIYLTGAAARVERVPITSSAVRSNRRKTSPVASSAEEASRQSTFERLLDAAAALFSQKGYAAASTREIAGILGIRKASLYYHIENKEDLLYAICKSSLHQIRHDVAAALEKVQDPLERTRTLVRAHIRSLVRDQIAHSVAVGEMRALSGARLKEVIALRDAYEGLVRSVLQDARKAGVLRDDLGVKYLCLILLGLLNRVELWYRREGALSPDQLARVFEAIFLTGAGRPPSELIGRSRPRRIPMHRLR
ncbi:MAG TPA: TetR family transcriptional regulator [Bryobacteraceae bacterium]|jgi:AcrR family transcriptional regulator|nr:TetR family transcriptional regulator [Bryobacteraceae bacterium]